MITDAIGAQTQALIRYVDEKFDMVLNYLSPNNTYEYKFLKLQNIQSFTDFCESLKDERINRYMVSLHMIIMFFLFNIRKLFKCLGGKVENNFNNRSTPYNYARKS